MSPETAEVLLEALKNCGDPKCQHERVYVVHGVDAWGREVLERRCARCCKRLK